MGENKSWKGIVDYYNNQLPVKDDTNYCSLNEGNTPLLEANSISKLTGCNIYLKYEGLNPTGSFKDRGMAMAVTKAVEQNCDTIICASTGNTAASAAAYAAKYGLRCIVLVPAGHVAMGKLSQAVMYGAKIVEVEENFDIALNMVREISQQYPITLVNSLNPHRISGQKTAAFEICDQLGRAPKYVSLPVGNAGNITAYWEGLREYLDLGKISSKPKLLGFQAKGASPIVKGETVTSPETVATAIRIGKPASWSSALQACIETQGQISAVTDEEIIAAYKLLASREGVFVEPASAASVAGIIKLDKENYFSENDEIVCVLTGNGLKDPDSAINSMDYQSRTVPADHEAVIKAIYED